MNEVKHTPLPYKVGRIKGENLTTIWRNDPDQSEDTNTGWALIGRDIKKEDAAFIVRACNSHYDLLDAAQWALDHYAGKHMGANTVPLLRAAIAKAKGVA